MMICYEMLMLNLQQEKMMNFGYCEENLRSISNKTLVWQC